MERNDERSAADWLAEGNAHCDAQRWNEAGIALERRLERAPILREGRGHAEGWPALFAKPVGGTKTTTA